MVNKTFKLTKQLKEDWLKALKSGEYEQFGRKLRNPDNHKQCCYLGVLAIIHPNIEISTDGTYCTVEGNDKQYEPFNEMGIHLGCKIDLTNVNDNSYHHDNIRDYSKVIPLIEQLPTVD